MAPAVVFGILLAIIAAYVASYLQPLGRYAYRALVHTVEHASLSAALREGTFVHAGGLTFFADRFAVDSGLLSHVFVHENSGGISFATTAAKGVLLVLLMNRDQHFYWAMVCGWEWPRTVALPITFNSPNSDGPSNPMAKLRFVLEAKTNGS